MSQEWYYPLLQPRQHYAPVWTNSSGTGLLEAVAWANRNPAAVRLHVLEGQAGKGVLLASSAL